MPYLAELPHRYAQNIKEGVIKLNGKLLHSGWTQVNADTFYEWLSKLDEPTTDVFIGDLRCTSTDVINLVIDFIGSTIDAEEGLKNLAIEHFWDKNKIEEWPLEQLAQKTHNLQSLKFHYLDFTTDDNKK